MARWPAESADIVLTAAVPAEIRAVRESRPGTPVAVAPETAAETEACVRAGADLLIGDGCAGAAAEGGLGLVCSAPDRAHGVRADGVLVRATTPAEAEALATAGHAVFADEAEIAVLSVYAWVGARVFRTDDPGSVRQALDMVASIRGTRPPAVARRGLA